MDLLIDPINYACNLNFTMQLFKLFFRLYIIVLESLVTNLTEMHTVLEIRNVVLYNVMYLILCNLDLRYLLFEE